MNHDETGQQTVSKVLLNWKFLKLAFSYLIISNNHLYVMWSVVLGMRI